MENCLNGNHINVGWSVLDIFPWSFRKSSISSLLSSFWRVEGLEREQLWKSIEANSLIRVETCGKVVESWGLMVKLFPQ